MKNIFWCIVEWLLVSMLMGYLVLITHVDEMLTHNVLACSDVDDYIQIPDQYKYLCGRKK
jgi:hypothetical protein